MNSTLESITIPSTLSIIKPNAFGECNGIKKIKFLDGRERLGRDEYDSCVWNKIFQES